MHHPASSMDAALSDLSLSDYDVISDPGTRSLDSSIADLNQMSTKASSEPFQEPAPTQEAAVKFNTATLSAGDVQAYARDALRTVSAHNGVEKPLSRVVRVYLDGNFDLFNAGHALQLRQAKLSFPIVHLTVGVFSDELCRLHGLSPTFPHVERCEVIRHCRWVDEVVPNAPWVIEDTFVQQYRIDYFALDEGATVDPAFNQIRLRGYDVLKRLGKVIPTRRTLGLGTPRVQSGIIPPLVPEDSPFEKTPVHESQTQNRSADITREMPNSTTVERYRATEPQQAPIFPIPALQSKIDDEEIENANDRLDVYGF